MSGFCLHIYLCGICVSSFCMALKGLSFVLSQMCYNYHPRGICCWLDGWIQAISLVYRGTDQLSVDRINPPWIFKCV